MRLRERDLIGIRTAADQAFDGNAVVRLFGSRLDSQARGGDIDLHIEADADTLNQERQRAFRRLLRKHVGERAIDTIFMARGSAIRAIDSVALREGVIL